MAKRDRVLIIWSILEKVVSWACGLFHPTLTPQNRSSLCEDTKANTK